MFLEIVTPEAILFSSEVDSFTAPGTNGEFQILNNHAPIVANLTEGRIAIKAANVVLDDKFKEKFETMSDKLVIKINSGTLELNDNKAMILAD
ncbi:MAG: hypothetical protein ABF250_01450 [Polaribacter sp.]|jgi:F-type H+-transporting ATPase subunit epsilon|uniref:hypothetical protein n=1 Tax=Polaribacter sp. TaxID=1920175 RepID=UPI002630419A|nr:hypothetical protein [uncultured Polaribacter sp.]